MYTICVQYVYTYNMLLFDIDLILFDFFGILKVFVTFHINVLKTDVTAIVLKPKASISW